MKGTWQALELARQSLAPVTARAPQIVGKVGKERGAPTR